MVQVDSHISGADKVSIKSGGDTNILGGVVKGNRVVTDIGGDLNIESLQDTAKFDSKQQSLGGSVSMGVLREYDLKSAANTGELQRNTLVERVSLEQTRADKNLASGLISQ